MNMIGKSGGLNTISNLLEIMGNADKVKAHIAEIKAAEDAHTERIKIDTIKLQQGFREVKDGKAAIAAAQAAVSERSAQLDGLEEDLKRRTAEHQKILNDFAEFERNTSAALADREEKLKAAEAKFAKASADKAAEQKRADAALVVREHDVTAHEGAANAREAGLIARETKVAEREAKMREFLS